MRAHYKKNLLENSADYLQGVRSVSCVRRGQWRSPSQNFIPTQTFPKSTGTISVGIDWGGSWMGWWWVCGCVREGRMVGLKESPTIPRILNTIPSMLRAEVSLWFSIGCPRLVSVQSFKIKIKETTTQQLKTVMLSRVSSEIWCAVELVSVL